MIDTKAIRSKILDAAVRGLLTQQLPEDGTAEELYQKIQKEKQKLIESGKIKMEKPLSEITEEEIPFEIPENWKWVRLGEVTSLQSGQDLNTESYNSKKEGIPYLTGASSFDDSGNLIFNRWTTKPRVLALKGDIVLTCKGTVGKLTILDVASVHIARQFMAIRVFISNVKYVEYFIMSKINRLKESVKGLIPGIERDDILLQLFPLPPLAEQKRIVKKVDKIFSLLDKIDMIQKCLVDNFAVLKSKLIDAAVRGQITQQLSKDGTAEELYQKIQKEKQKLIEAGKIKKEKPLPEITEDEIPFKIPKGWRWCRLEAIFNFIDYRGSTPNKISEGVPFVTAKNVRQGYIDYKIREYISEEDYNNRMSRGISHKGDLLFTTEAPMGYAAIADLEKFSAGQRLITLQQYTEEPLLENKYFMYAISTQFFQKQLEEKCSGTTVKGIKADRLKAFLIPLPPLSEQRRIVERLDELLEFFSS